VLGVAWEIDFWGKFRRNSESAWANLLAAQDARYAVMSTLVFEVGQAYLKLRALDLSLEISRRTVESRARSVDLVQARLDGGVAGILDFRQAQTLYFGATKTIPEIQRQIEETENYINILLGQNPVPIKRGRALDQQIAAPSLPPGLPLELLTRRPDIRQAEQQLIAANANIGAARAAFFPRITLSTSVGIASTQLSDLFKGGSLAWSFAPQLVLPIFDAGRNQANLDAAQVNRDIATAQYEKAVQSAFREVADALAGRATLGEQLRAQQAQAAAEQVRTKLADLRYRNGASSYLDVLDAQRSLFTAQQAVVQAQAAERQNRVTLYKVLGGGWKDAATQ